MENAYGFEEEETHFLEAPVPCKPTEPSLLHLHLFPFF